MAGVPLAISFLTGGVLRRSEASEPWEASVYGTSGTVKVDWKLQPLAAALQIERSDGFHCRAERLQESDEWDAIVKQRVEVAEVMCINAAPGSGKSTVLREWCRGRPDNNILVVAFNRAISEQLRANFAELRNVTVKTIHAVAYEATRHIHHNGVGDVSRTELKNFLGCQHWDEVEIQKKWLTDFCASAEDHLPGRPDARTRQRHTTLWEHFSSGRCSFNVPHDVYLKLFQLDPSLRARAFADYDTLVLDEAQDCTDCMLAALSCDRVACVMACDPRQNIYQFKAVNGSRLREMQVHHRMNLQQSFRFGETIAAFLTQIARSSPPPVDLGFAVRGMPGVATGLCLNAEPMASITQLLLEGKKATVLARKNSTLFMQAVRVLTDLADEKSAAFIGGFESFIESQLLPVMDLLYLSEVRATDIQSKYVKAFSSFGFLRRVCEEREDMNWLPKFGLYDALTQKRLRSGDVEELMDRFSERISMEHRHADVVFSTVHQAKGLGFENVVLLDDFLEAYTTEEYNIFYVACSRVSTGTSEATISHLESGRKGRKRPRPEDDFDFEAMYEGELWSPGYSPGLEDGFSSPGASPDFAEDEGSEESEGPEESESEEAEVEEEGDLEHEQGQSPGGDQEGKG